MSRLYILCGVLFSLLAAVPLCAVQLPTTLRVVELRWQKGQPELETWLGSLQGALNRQGGEAAIFLVRNETDAAWADTLAQMYHLKKETLSSGALLALSKPQLNGQVRYDPSHPWTRNVALTAAALAPGAVIATDHDLGLPTVLDVRDRWTDRLAAYQWEIEQYARVADAQTLALAPEGGNLLADLITARKLLAVDYSPGDEQESAALKALLARFPRGSRIIGAVGDRDGEADDAYWKLSEVLNAGGNVLLPTRFTSNLSCFARFPITRPLIQGRDEAVPEDNAESSLVLIYDGGSGKSDGAQAIDAVNYLLPLLNDPAINGLPVGVEVPMALDELAPAAYQALIARQRLTGVELIAAPNGSGWAQPMRNAPPAYLADSARMARAMDLESLALLDDGDQAAYLRTCDAEAAAGWRGLFIHPLPAERQPDNKPRESRLLPGALALVASCRVRTAEELRAALATPPTALPIMVIFMDPAGLPPAALRDVLPEIRAAYSLFTPSQALRTLQEGAPVMAYLQAQQNQNIRRPRRGESTLGVNTPTTTLMHPTAAEAIPVSVQITGEAQVYLARVTYNAPGGRVGAADLRNAGNGIWTATLPPTLRGGTLTVTARVVEADGFGITTSAPLTLTIPTVDSNHDGADDTLKEYLGLDPHHPNPDGDGLLDGIYPVPLRLIRDAILLTPPVIPPLDVPYLEQAGVSKAEAVDRLLPAKSTVTYRLPLKDIPAAHAFLRLLSAGPGTVTLNGGAPAPLEAMPSDTTPTELPLSGGESLVVTLTAGDQPLKIYALQIITNPAGPFLWPVQLEPAFPPAGVPIGVSVVVYAPRGIKAVHLRYGPSLDKLHWISLTPKRGQPNRYIGTLPKQYGNYLLYQVEALDNAGHFTAGPYAAITIGRTSADSVALLGSRDLRGTWRPAAVWNGGGRVLNGEKQGVDTYSFLPKPGPYYLWLLAQPRQRGIAVYVLRRDNATEQVTTLFNRAIPAGQDGWYKMGTFTADDTGRHVTVVVSTYGPQGYCAYETLVLTQDAKFVPPLTYAGIDWFNSLVVSGVTDGETVGRTITINALPTGNLDFVDVKLSPASSGKELFTKEDNGNYTYDARFLPPGGYTITVTGYRDSTEYGKRRRDAYLTVTVNVVVPPR